MEALLNILLFLLLLLLNINRNGLMIIIIYSKIYQSIAIYNIIVCTINAKEKWNGQCDWNLVYITANISGNRTEK